MELPANPRYSGGS